MREKVSERERVGRTCAAWASGWMPKTGLRACSNSRRPSVTGDWVGGYMYMYMYMYMSGPFPEIRCPFPESRHPFPGWTSPPPPKGTGLGLRSIVNQAFRGALL